MKEHFLHKKLQQRTEMHAFRQLRQPGPHLDFCSNDYLGIVTNGLLEQSPADASLRHGSTGSRLLSGNHVLIEGTEHMIAMFHNAEAGLIFNSGYDANTGLLSCVPQRGDTIIYDQLCHASIRDGIRLSFAQSFAFRHNDMEDLESKLRAATGEVFIVTESVFSMDGDMAPLQDLTAICRRHGSHLILDEAHATGVIGRRGEGLAQASGLHSQCFARIHTFGKGVGAHGAVVLGSSVLRDYLINFSRAFIYTTALPESSIAAVKKAYGIFPGMQQEREHLQALVKQFQAGGKDTGCHVLHSTTPIQGIMVPGNEAARHTASLLQQHGFDVRPILYPTVPKGSERLRIVLHSFNTAGEVEDLLQAMRYGL